jgi:lysophospholipase L1-like esterase
MKSALLIQLFLFSTGVVPAQDPPYTREQEWAQEIGAFVEIDQKQTPPAGAVVFTGSSTIRMWKSLRADFPHLKVINRGFGGSRLEDLVFFAPKIVQPYKPKKIVVYSGENDIEAGQPPEDALADFKEFLAFRDKNLPKTPVVYISMKPSILRWNLWPAMKKANELIKSETRRHRNVSFVDISEKMLAPDGGKPPADIFLADGLHLNAKGYAIIRQVLLPYLK